MNKQDFTKTMSTWLESFLLKRHSNEFYIEIVIPESNFSKMPHESIKKLDAYTSFDFHTDVVGLMTNKKSGQVEVALLNRSISAISLKEIGEMNCYSKLLKPKYSFIASLKGLPEEINLILLSDLMENKLLKITETNHIHVFKWDAINNKIDELSLFPRKSRLLS